jgi:PAS domain S-box-containing protein
MNGEQHLALSQHVARLGSWERDYTTGRTEWSAELYRLLGVQPGSVEPGWQTLMLHVDPQDRPLLEAECRRVMAEGGRLFALVRGLEAPRTFAVRGSLELDDRGRPLHSIGTLQDVTDTTAGARAPGGRAGTNGRAGTDGGIGVALSQASIGLAPIGMAVVDVRPGHVIRRLMTNPALAELMGLSPADLAKDHLMERVHPDDQQEYVEHLKGLVTGEVDAVRDLEVRIVRPDGSQRWASVSGHLVRDADLVPEYLVAHFRDITRRRQVEQQLQERAARDARVAAILQDHLLPHVPKQVGPLTVASRYVPMASGELVGGDWTDVFALPNGRIGIVVGDVSGHGIEAAATMSQLRAVVRMLATSGLSPAGVLRRLNDTVHDTAIPADTTLRSGADLATLVHAQLDPATGVVRYSSAGHPPLLLLSPDGGPHRRVAAIPAQDGPPIGVTAEVRYPEEACRIEPGSFVVGFTDGLIESGDDGPGDQLLGLQVSLADLPADRFTSAETLADALLDLASCGRQLDDRALMVARLEPTSAVTDA